MQGSPALPKPAATAASAVSSMSARAGRAIAFLGAGVAPDPLAEARAGLVERNADGVEPTNWIALDVRVLRRSR